MASSHDRQQRFAELSIPFRKEKAPEARELFIYSRFDLLQQRPVRIFFSFFLQHNR